MANMLGGLTRPGHPLEHSFGTSEGLADWIALLAGGTGVIGEGWKGKDTFARNYDLPNSAGGSGTRQYDCLDCFKVGDFYNGGLLNAKVAALDSSQVEIQDGTPWADLRATRWWPRCSTPRLPS